MEEILTIVGGGLIVVAIIVGSVVGIKFIDVHYIDNIPTVVKVDGKKVYEGSSAGVNITSSGANTTVTIRGGFLYFFPKAYYTSADVELVAEK